MIMRKIPYLVRLFWSGEDGCYVAEVPELKGCSGLGKTPETAIREANRSMINWLKVAKKEGVPIPTPSGARRSSRLNLRLPEEIVSRIKREAVERRMSINQYLLWRLAS